VGRDQAAGPGEERPEILIVEDEPGIVDFLVPGLGYEGFATRVARDGATGLRMALEREPDLIVLDLMLPGMDGFAVCRSLREHSDVPVIMLTARDELRDRVHGLEIGADDYITKPFHFRELAARIRAVLRRRRAQATGDVQQAGGALRVQDIALDPNLRLARRGGRDIALTRREFELLELLMRNPDRILARDTILDRVWGQDFLGDDNIIEVYVRYLRQKLGEPNPITTVRGAGYVMRTQPPPGRDGEGHAGG
jgi:two-component system response regulator MprA